jgi:hypothetical protein
MMSNPKYDPSAPDTLIKLQTSFAAHIRDPGSVAAPEGIEDRRMGIYRRLFFNNVRNFLSNNFPVLKTLYDDESWATLCREFYREFRCHTPLFPEIPREFLKYLQDHRKDHVDDLPFMLELAHYEWIELALSLDETRVEDIEINPDGDLLSGIPVLSPVAWLISYRFPVHRIRVDYQPQNAPENPTHLLAWRRTDYQVKFMQLNEISTLLLQEMKEDSKRTGIELLTSIAGIINHPNPEVVIRGGADLLDELKNKQVILGTRL